MGCELKTNVKLDYIQDFEMMFDRMKISRPREASIYYVTLVMDAPKEFSDFLKTAEDLANITRRPLETGRAQLMKNGLIAKVLFANETNENFGREAYLPAHPAAIWQTINHDLKQVVAEETYRAVEHHISTYVDAYHQNFRKYGIKLQRNGNVTLQYSGKWILYGLLSSCLDSKNTLKMQVGGEHLFKDPYFDYFKKFLEMDTKVQLLVDTTVDDTVVKQLKSSYGDNVDIRFFAEEVSGTVRNYVYGKEIAVNGIKILPEENDEPSYIGTAYVQLDDIEALDSQFKSLWDMAKPVATPKTTTKNTQSTK
jgi:hypothetical protein